MASKNPRKYHLAQPKRLPPGFTEDRRSVYWENGIQPKDYSKVTEPVLTPRQELLVRPKQKHKGYMENCPSSIWPVSKSALLVKSTDRICELARPKSLHKDYQCSKEVNRSVSRRALSAQATPRLRNLALHKTYPPLLIKPNSEWEWSEWPSDIKPAALSAEASSRIETLCCPKKLHHSYEPNGPVQWPISVGSLNYIATERLLKLACPKEYRDYKEDYNPRAWTVSRAALMAQSSPSIERLATPLPRKCQQKRTT